MKPKDSGVEMAFDPIGGIKTIVEWMCKDIECMKKGDANVAIALCILTYSEALGRFMKATSNNPAKGLGLCAFIYFFDKMGYNASESQIIYKKLRNGMAHSYIPNKKANFDMVTGSRGIDITNPNDIHVNLLTLIDEFDKATQSILSEISPPDPSGLVTDDFKRTPPIVSGARADL